MQIKKHIPNSITLLNVFCGSTAAFLAANDDFVQASFFVFLGIFLDFFDGFLARILKVSSALGVQLDSLADMVTSGLVPGVIMFKLIAKSLGDWGVLITEDMDFKPVMFLPFLGFMVTVSSAYRLAKFNLDTEQSDYFKGLPTPANALLIISLPLILEFQHSFWAEDIILNPWFLIGLTLFSCFMLNTKIRLFALKFKTLSFKPNALRYIFLLICFVLLIVFKFLALPLMVMLYIIMSVINNTLVSNS